MHVPDNIRETIMICINHSTSWYISENGWSNTILGTSQQTLIYVDIPWDIYISITGLGKVHRYKTGIIHAAPDTNRQFLLIYLQNYVDISIYFRSLLALSLPHIKSTM